jgi:hypothetical protein
MAGLMHFSPQQEFGNTVIDLMFIRAEDSIVLQYDMLAGARGCSDHAPLTIMLPGPDSYILATCWTISVDSDEEKAYLATVLSGLEPLLQQGADLVVEIDEVVQAILEVFAKAWSAHAKEKHLSKNSKGWWMDAFSHNLAMF